jgi:DNA-binding transcriptional LysR family regulator
MSRSLRALVQSPSSLFSFEAAARLGSFTKAGAELNVTQGAISRSIKQLEESLGVQLFLRQKGRVTLSEVGERFFADVTMGMNYIRRSIDAISQKGDHGFVTISVSTAYATFLFVPRVGRFRAAHPEIDLRLQTTDKDIDIGVEGLSLGIRRGNGTWPQYDAAFLTDEVIEPVCSPAFLKENPIDSLDDLVKSKLIHLVEPYRPRPTWRDWFASQGLPERDVRGLEFNDYAVCLQAAIEGDGVALGWRHLTRDMIKRGALVRPLKNQMKTGIGFYVVTPKGRRLSAHAALVRDWLLSQSSQ